MTRVIGTMGDKSPGHAAEGGPGRRLCPGAQHFCKCTNHVRYVFSCNGPCVKSGTC